jgi:hypothetical protein
VETCAGKNWSPAIEVSLELVPREFCFEITANEGPLGRSVIRCRTAVAPLDIRTAQLRPDAKSWLSNSWLIVTTHSIRDLRATDTRNVYAPGRGRRVAAGASIRSSRLLSYRRPPTRGTGDGLGNRLCPHPTLGGDGERDGFPGSGGLVVSYHCYAH